MEIKDKELVCKIYDSILRKNEAIQEILLDEQIEDLKKESNYSTEKYQEQLEIMNQVVLTAQRVNPNLSTNEIIEFITNPRFRVQIDIENNSLNTENHSIQDSILLRKAYNQIIIEPSKKEKTGKKTGFLKLKNQKIDVIPITKLTKIDIGKDIYYILEEIMYVYGPVYNKIIELIKKQQAQLLRNGEQIDNIDIDFAIRLWKELEKKQYDKYCILDKEIYRDMNKFAELFQETHGIELPNNWVETDPFIIDNRLHSEKLVTDKNVAGTFTLKNQMHK